MTSQEQGTATATRAPDRLERAIAILEGRHDSLIRQAITANNAVGQRTHAVREARWNGEDAQEATAILVEAQRSYRSLADRAEELAYAISVITRAAGEGGTSDVSDAPPQRDCSLTVIRMESA